MLKRRRKGPIYHRPPREPVPKSINRVLISAGTLFAGLLILGAGYTFYTDKNAQPTSAITRPVAPTFSQAIRPTKPATNGPVGAAVESFSSLAYPSGSASISVKTTAGAACKIDVMYNNQPAGEPSLKPQIADDYGTVNWTWTVSPAAPLGMWPINVTCSAHGKSGVVQAQLDVTTK